MNARKEIWRVIADGRYSYYDNPKLAYTEFEQCLAAKAEITAGYFDDAGKFVTKRELWRYGK